MGHGVENLCVGCPQGCISCGRKHVFVCYCDDCGKDIEYDEKLYLDAEGYELCQDCYLKQFEKREAEEGETCASCGYEEDTLYRVDGEWICRDCVMDNAEKVHFDE